MNMRLGEFRSLRLGQMDRPVYAVALSGDGQYAAVGCERGVLVYDKAGHERLRYPAVPASWPVSLLAVAPDMTAIWLGSREGRLIRLDIEKGPERFACQVTELYWAANDLYSLALSDSLIAIGHLSPALTVLERDGIVIWRKHQDNGNATGGSIWQITLDEGGNQLFAGSAGAGSNQLSIYSARSGAHLAQYAIAGRLTHVATLAGDDVALVASNRDGSSRLVVYRHDFSQRRWELVFPEPIMALAADKKQPVLAIATGYQGELHLLDAASGEPLVPPHVLRAQVEGLDLAEDRPPLAEDRPSDEEYFPDGKYVLGAVTADGYLTLLQAQTQQGQTQLL